LTVAPSQGRGLKLIYLQVDLQCDYVAPSQGRGLKPNQRDQHQISICRPFTGAWIETWKMLCIKRSDSGRPFTGAWIETITSSVHLCRLMVAPSQGRGLKLAVLFRALLSLPVAPSQGRGLKLHNALDISYAPRSPLHRGVD